MLRFWLARLCSLFALIGAALLLLVMLNTYGMYIPAWFLNFYVNPRFQTVETLLLFAAPLASEICFLLALLGLLLVQRSRWGQLAAGIAMLGEALAVGDRGLFIWPLSGFTWMGSAALAWYNTLSLLAGVLIALGLLGCGVFTLSARALPRWNVVPLLLGLWLAFNTARTLLSPQGFFVFYNSFTGPTPPKDVWVFILTASINVLLWGSLGVGLWPGKNRAQPQVQPVIVPAP